MIDPLEGKPLTPIGCDGSPKQIEEAVFSPPSTKELPDKVTRCGQDTGMAKEAAILVKAQASYLIGRKVDDGLMGQLMQVVGNMLHPKEGN